MVAGICGGHNSHFDRLSNGYLRYRPCVYYYYTTSELFITNLKHYVVAVNDYFEINKVEV